MAAGDAFACTNFLISSGASADGSTMITYAADSHQLYGELYYTPAGRHAPGSMLDVYEWDTGKHLGRIKQVPMTYSVVGNMNEHQVSIGETTWGGRHELHDPEQPVEILRTIHSFDPCIACAVHVNDPEGEELVQVKVT